MPAPLCISIRGEAITFSTAASEASCSASRTDAQLPGTHTRYLYLSTYSIGKCFTYSVQGLIENIVVIAGACELQKEVISFGGELLSFRGNDGQYLVPKLHLLLEAPLVRAIALIVPV